MSGLITGTVGSTFNQHGPYTVTVTATDLAFNSANTTFTWTVQNIPPTVIDHYYVTTTYGLQAPNAAFGVLVGSSDPGAETIQAILDQAPRMERSFWRLDGSFTYTPVAGFIGLDSFSYHGYDGLSGGNLATAILDVGNASPPVIVNPGNQINTEGDTVNLPIQLQEPPGYIAGFAAAGLPPGLSISLYTGLISGTVGSTFTQHGPYMVTVTAANSALITATVNFTWTVNNLPPVVTNHAYGAAANNPLVVDAGAGVLAGSSDPGQESLRAVMNQPPLHGTLALNSDGSFTFIAASGYSGTDSFTYHAFDGLNNSNVAMVNLQIGSTTSPKVTNPGDQVNTEGQAVNLQVKASLPGGESLIYAASGLPLGLSIQPGTGLISGSVVSSFTQHGPYAVTVTVSDASMANMTTVGFNWTVDNLAPIVTSRVYAVAVDSPITVASEFGVLRGSSDPGQESAPGGAGSAADARDRVAQQRRILHIYSHHRVYRNRYLHVPRLRRP